MIGWILYNKLAPQLTAKDHAINHLLAAAKEKNIKIKIVTADQFDLIVSKDTQSILLEGKILSVASQLSGLGSTPTVRFLKSETGIDNEVTSHVKSKRVTGDPQDAL